MLIVLFAACESDKKSKVNITEVEISDEELLNKGRGIAMNTFSALSTELQRAMREGGVSNAIQYCNLTALSITDSLSVFYSAKIKRTSDKVRNPQNTATDSELVTLNNYKEQLENQEVLKPTIKTISGEKVFHAPIILSNMCLNCHGQKDKIKDYKSIAALYPNDKATGYAAGDLGGIWSVTFKK
jgi:hypothetical protein